MRGRLASDRLDRAVEPRALAPGLGLVLGQLAQTLERRADVGDRLDRELLDLDPELARERLDRRVRARAALDEERVGRERLDREQVGIEKAADLRKRADLARREAEARDADDALARSDREQELDESGRGRDDPPRAGARTRDHGSRPAELYAHAAEAPARATKTSASAWWPLMARHSKPLLLGGPWLRGEGRSGDRAVVERGRGACQSATRAEGSPERLDHQREMLLASLLLERRLVPAEGLVALGHEIARLRASGGSPSLAALLLRDRLLEADRLRALLREVEARGRTCAHCGRGALVGPAGPASCPSCQGALGPLAPAVASTLPGEDIAPLTPSWNSSQARLRAMPPAAPLTPAAPPSIDREATTVRDRLPPAAELVDQGAATERLADARLSTQSSGRLRAIAEESRPTVKLSSSGLDAPPPPPVPPPPLRASAILSALPASPPPPVPPPLRASAIRAALPASPPPISPPPVSPPPLRASAIRAALPTSPLATPVPGARPSSSGGASSGSPEVGPSQSGARRALGRQLGRKLGPYEIQEELGSGGMGVVYRARHTANGDFVALKVLLAGDQAAPRIRARFQEEARSIGKLSHANIVSMLDSGEVDGTLYYTMQLVDGDLLHDLMVRGQLKPEKGAEYLRDVARAAHHAHERGIVHRDLKPANVIVERATGRPYVMDFGLAKNLTVNAGLSLAGVALGTPHYMSPEQAQGLNEQIDGRSDVYSLGAMLYEILAGRAPFDGDSQADLMVQIVESEPTPPSTIQPGARLDLQSIALKALAKQQSDRYETAAAMADDLDRALRGEAPTAQSELASAAPAGGARGARWPWVLAAVLGLLAVVVVGVGIYAYEKTRERALARETPK